MQQECHSVLVKLHPVTFYRTVFLDSVLVKLHPVTFYRTVFLDSVLVKLHPVTFYRTVFLDSVLVKLHPVTFCRTVFLDATFCFLWFTNYVPYSYDNSLIPGCLRLLAFILNNTRCLVFYNPSPPRMFLSLDLLSEYRIQHGAIGPLFVTSSYSTWIFCRGVSGFATDCRGLITCLLCVGPPFEIDI